MIKMDMKEKRGIALEHLSWWLIALAVLVIVLVLAFVLKEKLIGLVDHIKDIFRGR